MKPNTYSAERPARMVIETIDGRAYVANSAAIAVDRMRADAWACTERTASAYMHGVARRVVAWNKYPVRADEGADTFINDLHAAGLLTIREIN
jgi:hypothetical protein